MSKPFFPFSHPLQSFSIFRCFNLTLFNIKDVAKHLWPNMIVGFFLFIFWFNLLFLVTAPREDKGVSSLKNAWGTTKRYVIDDVDNELIDFVESLSSSQKNTTPERGYDSENTKASSGTKEGQQPISKKGFDVRYDPTNDALRAASNSRLWSPACVSHPTLHSETRSHEAPCSDQCLKRVCSEFEHDINRGMRIGFMKEITPMTTSSTHNPLMNSKFCGMIPSPTSITSDTSVHEKRIRCNKSECSEDTNTQIPAVIHRERNSAFKIGSSQTQTTMMKNKLDALFNGDLGSNSENMVPSKRTKMFTLPIVAPDSAGENRSPVFLYPQDCIEGEVGGLHEGLLLKSKTTGNSGVPPINNFVSHGKKNKEPGGILLNQDVSSASTQHSTFPYRILRSEDKSQSFSIDPLCSSASIFFAERIALSLGERLGVLGHDVWNIQTILPFVYSIMTRNISAGKWRRLCNMTVYIFEEYNRQYIIGKGFDSDNLARFLEFHTIISYQASYPGIELSTSQSLREMEYKIRKRRSTLHSVCRLFYAIHDEERFLSSFGRQSVTKKRKWASAYVSYMLNTIEEYFSPTEGLNLTMKILWDKWVFWSNRISGISGNVFQSMPINLKNPNEPLFISHEIVMEYLRDPQKNTNLPHDWQGELMRFYNMLEKEKPTHIHSSSGVHLFTYKLSAFMKRYSSKELYAWMTLCEMEIIPAFVNNVDLKTE